MSCLVIVTLPVVQILYPTLGLTETSIVQNKNVPGAVHPTLPRRARLNFVFLLTATTERSPARTPGASFANMALNLDHVALSCRTTS